MVEKQTLVERLWQIEQEQWKRLYDRLFHDGIRPTPRYPNTWKEHRHSWE